MSEATTEIDVHPLPVLANDFALWRPRGEDTTPGPAHIPKLIWEILRARGITSTEAVEKWLKPSLKLLRDPFSLTDMEKAVRRLLEARRNQDAIVIYADYDLDGTSALAMLLKAFGDFGFENVKAYQPKRLSEGYGLHKAAIQKLYDDGCRLLVSVDLGITAIEEVEFANELGLDVIITDHHLPKESLPRALAVINPNRGNCPAGLGHLCGTGVAFYLALALRRSLSEEGIEFAAFDPKSLLDCFVIGTLTDLVPLVDENRVLVKHGLKALAETKRPGLRALLEALELSDRPLTAQDVAIRFAPKLNALSRMEMGIQPIDLYLEPDEEKARALVKRVLTNNDQRKASQKSAEQEALELVHNNPPKSSIFVYSKNFHRGVVGLVATKLCQDLGLPAFVGSLDDETGTIVGSARMPEGLDYNATEAMGEAQSCLKQFGGHAVAAGFELEVARAEDFRIALEKYFSRLHKTTRKREFVYDAEAQLSELDSDFMAWHEVLGPFGAQFPPPVFLIRTASLGEVRELSGGHLRLTMHDGRGFKTALWFSPPKDHPHVEDLRNIAAALVQQGRKNAQMLKSIDVLVEPQWNFFAGQKTLQFLLKDLKFS